MRSKLSYSISVTKEGCNEQNNYYNSECMRYLVCAYECHAQSYEIMNARAISDGYCHCGYAREKTIISMVQMEICPKHGPSCMDYYSTHRAWYYYCTNKNCNDNYQSEWILLEYKHD